MGIINCGECVRAVWKRSVFLADPHLGNEVWRWDCGQKVKFI